jgi:hypothetical protein
MDPLPFFHRKKKTSNQLISQSNKLTNTVAKSPFSEWTRLPSLMAASVDRAARLLSRTPKPAPRTCANDLPSDEAPTAAHHAFIAYISATFLRKNKTHAPSRGKLQQ